MTVICSECSAGRHATCLNVWEPRETGLACVCRHRRVSIDARRLRRVRLVLAVVGAGLLFSAIPTNSAALAGAGASLIALAHIVDWVSSIWRRLS